MKTQDDKYILKGPERNYQYSKNLCLAEVVHRQLKAHGPKVAQIHAITEEKVTFRQILNVTQRLAIYLRSDGLKVNDRVAVCSENHLNFCLPVYAGLFAGATICPLNPKYSKGELLHALSISKPKYIFVSPLAVTHIQESLKDLSYKPTIIALCDVENGHKKIPSIMDLAKKVSLDETSEFRVTQVDAKTHVAAILCSSGTTGLPKGVMLTDRNVIIVLEDSNEDFTEVNSVSLDLLPFFHAYSFVVMFIKSYQGITGVLLPYFEETIFLATIQKYRIEQLTLVPPLMVFLAKHPLVDKYDLSSVKHIWVGAAPLSRKIKEAVQERLKIKDIRQGYGMTETTLAVLKTPEGCTKHGSVGQVVPGISAKVICVEDESGKPLGPNCVGELCFKGSRIMEGYCGDEKATAMTIDRDGWLHTGDLGYYDEEGYFYIVDRLKELIKYKAFQVPPAELEAILLRHPGIKDAAVIGVPDEEAGELPLAFVVKQPGANVSASELSEFVNARVSNPKRLRGGIKFLEDIPKTASGKILRRQLRDALKSKL